MRKTTGSSFMRKDRRTVGQKNSKIEGKQDGRTVRQKDSRMEGQQDGRTVGWKDSRIEGQKEEVNPKGIKGKWWRRNAF